MHLVNHHDPEYQRACIAYALETRKFIQELSKLPGNSASWAQEVVMLAMLDGAATCAAAAGISQEAIISFLGERWTERRKEMAGAFQGSLHLPIIRPGR